jgi:hypothetical protein
VGHSEGGLIGRYYVQNLDGARRVCVRRSTRCRQC